MSGLREGRVVAAASWTGGGDAGEPPRPDAIEPGAWRRMSRLGRVAATVAAPLLGEEPLRRAWGEDGPADLAGMRSGVALAWGTGFGEFASSVGFLRSVLTRGPAGASPLVFQVSVHNAAAGQLSIALGLRGPSLTLCGVDGLAGQVLFQALAWGDSAAPVLVLAADELGPEVRAGLEMAAGAPVTGARPCAAALLFAAPGVAGAAGEGSRLALRFARQSPPPLAAPEPDLSSPAAALCAVADAVCRGEAGTFDLGRGFEAEVAP